MSLPSTSIDPTEQPRIARALVLMVLVFMALAFAIVPALTQAQKPVTITVHADKPSGAYHPIWNFFGADEPNYLYAPNGQKLLHE